LPIYLVYAINNPATKEQFDSSLKGVGVPYLHLGEIRKTNIIHPPLSLQQTFAAQIEAIEQQKALVRRSLDETRTLLAARMQYYFE
jgi:type I restriction enzyme S subunit